jgi:hypothetical protein
MNKKKYCKNALLLLIVLGLVSGGTFHFLSRDVGNHMPPPTVWQAYASEDQRFEVQFPKEPQKSLQEMIIANKRIQFNEMRSEQDSAVYAVSYLDFPGHWKMLGTKKLLTRSFDYFLEEQPNVEAILHYDLSMHQGTPSLHYKLKQEGREVEGKFLISGNTLYRIAVSYPLAAKEAIQSGPFFDSFQLKA